MRWGLFIIIAAICLPCFAFENEKALADPNRELQAQKIFKQIRCLVCQGESLAESNADLAVNMRSMIREKVAAGESGKQIRQYLVWRYGKNILQKPPFEAQTYFLWLIPLILLASGLIMILRITFLKNHGRSRVS